MPDTDRQKVHAARALQHRQWAEEALHPDAKQSHLAMAEMHAQAARDVAEADPI